MLAAVTYVAVLAVLAVLRPPSVYDLIDIVRKRIGGLRANVPLPSTSA